MIYFTICSKNFTSYALALWASLTEHHPDAKFHMVLCDSVEGFDPLALPFPVITIDDLGITGFSDMVARYNITELNTALKPFAFQYLFNRHPDQFVIYLDPDIAVLSQFVELEELVAGGADCILTPHLCEPAEFAEVGDLAIIKYGIYNLGFCGLRDTPNNRRVVAWWGRRLKEHCVIDFNRGLFVDQKWADYFPAFIPSTAVLTHPGYNVAYWNLSQRKLRWRDGECLANGAPIRFFHFSGNKIEDEDVFTRHCGEFNVYNVPELRGLLDDYRRRVLTSGHSSFSILPFAFNWSGSSGFNEHTPERLRRTAEAEEASKRKFLPFSRFRSEDHFLHDRTYRENQIARRRALEEEAQLEDGLLVQEGYCSFCEKRTKFVTSDMYGFTDRNGKFFPNWREHQSCECGFTNRLRAVWSLLKQEFPPEAHRSVYISEQVTPFFAKVQTAYADVTGSEYVSPDARPGADHGGIRHEDIQTLSFANSSFDLLVSLDVLEHVPSPDVALEEFFRVLKPGGTAVLTFPFSFDHAKDVVRAELRGGEITHFMEPEYHGNPMDMDKGALCFRYFSWDVLDRMRKIGFRDVAALSCWSDEHCHYSDGQFIIVGRR
jgi:SAM-dependent methyltransferase